MLLYRNANDVREQRLRDQARFGVTSRGRSERATVPANEVLAFAFVKARGTAHLFQNPKSCFDPLVAVFACNLRQVLFCYRFSDFAKCVPKLART